MYNLIIISSYAQPSIKAAMVSAWLSSEINAKDKFQADVLKMSGLHKIINGAYPKIRDYSCQECGVEISDDRWLQADAFIFLADQQDSDYSRFRKSIILSGARFWANKTTGIVACSGDEHGKNKAAGHLGQELLALHANVVGKGLSISDKDGSIKNGLFLATRPLNISLNLLLDHLLWWVKSQNFNRSC